jgi:hypothetical protein
MNFVISKETKLEQDAVHFYYKENLVAKGSTRFLKCQAEEANKRISCYFGVLIINSIKISIKLKSN